MSWQGANVVRRRRASKDENRRSEETVEAALNRLSKAYNTAMTCVGAWNRVSQLEDSDLAKLRHVGRAARRTFEEGVLLDPLISEKHAPLLNHTLETKNSQPKKKHSAVELRSNGHKSTVEQLAYLSLVNYADLLLAGCGRKEGSPSNVNTTLLDRGLVKPLKKFHSETAWVEMARETSLSFIGRNSAQEALVEPSRTSVANVSGDLETLLEKSATNEPEPMDTSNDNNSSRILDLSIMGGEGQSNNAQESSTNALNDPILMEREEPESVTVRLALVAYIDATAIDSTDPTVWLKLACSARRLGRLVTATESMDPTAFLSYRHLEKYALEQAYTSLPVGVPPNRMAERALEEWRNEEDKNASLEYLVDVRLKQDPMRIVDVPVLRYSWSNVGRMLLRFCSEGLQQNSSPVLSSPNIKLKLSPLLALPSSTLGEICRFLQPADIYRFEATCHALSSAIVAARAALDHKAVRRESLPSSQPQGRKELAISAGKTQGAVASCTENKVGEKTQAPASRASKRVRSQIITSGKRAERESRRSSTKFCLLSATLGCTEESFEYRAAVEAGHESSRIGYPHAINQGESSSTGVSKKHGRVKISPPSSDYSLYDFVQAFVEQPQTPFNLLCDFVSKIAMNVADVFQSDHNSYILASIILECFEVICQIFGHNDGRTMCWSKAPANGFFGKLGLFERFAVDLLDAELSLLKCEQDSVREFEFGGYSSVVVSKAPFLMSLIPVLEAKVGVERMNLKEWAKLKCRCYWLNSGLYLWEGRLSHNVTDSREAETLGIEAVQQAMNCLKGCSLDRIATPHLLTPSRKGQVWKELSLSSLSSFKNEVQASSILLQTEESFLEIIAEMDGMERDHLLADEHLTSLDAIGSNLLSRYTSLKTAGDPAKHNELVLDLLNEHGSELLSRSIWDDPNNEERQAEWFQNIIPVFHIEKVGYFLDLRRPCLLTIILSCIQTKLDRHLDVLNLLISVCNSVSRLWDEVQSQLGDRIEEISFKRAGSDSDDDSLDSYQEGSFSGSENESKRSRLRQYSVLYRLLVGRISLLCEAESVYILDFAAINEVVYAGLRLTSLWSHIIDFKDARDGDFLEDIRMFHAIQHLKRAIRDQHLKRTVRNNRDNCCEAIKQLEKLYVTGMIEVICQQRKILEKISTADCDRNQRSLRSRIVRRRCELLELTCCDLGLTMSENVVTVVDFEVERSILFSESSTDRVLSSIAALCESVLWMWGASSGTSSVDNQSTAERLRASTACVIVGLCGSASSTLGIFQSSSEGEKTISLDEFYDSDSSTIHWVADCGDEADTERSKSGNLLRVLNQAIHCISNVFNSIDEKEAAIFSYSRGNTTKAVPVLPLIVVRVLNSFSDHLLKHFADEGKEPSVWSQYPVGIRSTGQILDALLHKAYKCLHGFSLGHDNKDAQSGPIPSSEKSRYSPPESPGAAASLYRCILRTYSQGRRSPPKPALEAILSVLPPSDETTKSSDIRTFLFSKDGPWITTKEWCGFVKQSDGWDTHFASIQKWIIDGTLEEERCLEDEITIVRRGVSNLLAQSNISPVYEAGGDEDLRSVAVQMEEENARKFFAIIDSLCLGNANDYESWFSAAQCLLAKSETIADRLGLSNGFGRISNFTPSSSKCDQERKLPFGQLLEEQGREHSLAKEGWLRCLGKDLSVYVRYTWSSLESLKSLSQAVLSGYRDDIIELQGNEETPSFELQVWNEIELLRLKADHNAWQQAWGGLFVSALRTLGSRCAQLAIYSLHKRKADEDLQIVLSEITESMGIFFYTDLMASQLYGYPMRLLTSFNKRQIAEASLACFERSVETACSKDEVLRTSWDLKLMIGKVRTTLRMALFNVIFLSYFFLIFLDSQCHEKIANTYWGEELSVSAENDSSRMRKYEYHMSKALNSYNASLIEARDLESANELIVEGTGGSSHGSAEPLYRLHASRLKCLVRAINWCESTRDLAELEALRITECFWYAKEPNPDDQRSIRDRVWDVLVDIVTAMVQFRHDLSYFHRSVYRYAQALMWAPVFHDPVGQRSNGSLGKVPAVKASKLRGLNYSTNAACSGVVVMASLFEKKRQQLCAVWVTRDSSESAFSALNASIRKYDSLRGKYTCAYIESLCLCEQRTELESFLKWVYSCKRDLPSYFSASASNGGNKPKKSHANDCLLIRPRALSSHYFLTTIKRETNRALAILILSDLKKSPDRDGVDSNEDLLKLAYACYLRLNCGIDDLTKGSSWRYRNSGAKEVVKALTTAYLRFNKDSHHSEKPANWSSETFSSNILSEAVRKCQKLFPSHSGGFIFSKKKIAKQKAEAGAKRKDPPSTEERRPFEVRIPDGLKVGDTFVTSIEDGEKIFKKVRLTVPEGASHTLRFHL